MRTKPFHGAAGAGAVARKSLRMLTLTLRMLLLILFALCPARAQEALPPADAATARKAAQHCHRVISATYDDSLGAMRTFQTSVAEFLNEPTARTLDAARAAWRKSREPYSLTEAFRFSGGPIDSVDGPEERLNAWPLDEAFIDVVPGAAVVPVIADERRFPVVDVALLRRLNMSEGEKNISCGWHAVEFLLWGQDTSAVGPGKRPVTDFTTAPHAVRRAAWLRASTAALIEDLEPVAAAWREGKSGNYRARMDALEPDDALRTVVRGMVMLSGFELASERILVPCETRTQEEEQSCFSDNTAEDIRWNMRGLENLWTGTLNRTDGSVLKGPGVRESVVLRAPELAAQVDDLLRKAIAQAAAMPRFDQAVVEPPDGPGQRALRELSATLEGLSTLLKEYAVRMGKPFTAEELEG